MPRFNTLGSAVTGVAGATLGIDGSTPATFVGFQSGNADWIDDDHLIVSADLGTGFHLYSYKVTAPFTLTLLQNTGANMTKGGGGAWAAFIAPGGVRWSVNGVTFPMAGLADVSTDATVVLKQNYQADNGIAGYINGNLVWTLATGYHSGRPITLRDSVLAYARFVDGYHLVTVPALTDLAWTKQTADVDVMIPVLFGGVRWVVERTVETTPKLCLRQANSTQGFVIAQDVNLWEIDAIALSATTIRIGWSANTLDSVSGLIVADVVPGSGGATWTKSTVSGGVLVPVVQSPLSVASFPGTAQGGQAGGLEMVARHPMMDAHGIVTREWLKYFRRMERFSTALPNLANATGVLPPGSGGTGGTGGLSPVDGHNINEGSIPISKLETQPWIPLAQGAFLIPDGNMGEDGSPGPPGPPGAAGATGATGPSGQHALGWDGADGDDGAMGAPGPQGPTGSAGATGPQGPMALGWDGSDGDDGPPGAPGPQGTQGPTGATGPAGQHALGWDGADGDDGAPGAPGPQGVQGPTGATGPAGAMALGWDGADGDEGAIGAPGAAGAAGATGPQGPLAVGWDGADGDDGAFGAPGVQGPTGATGVTGTAGAQPEELLALIAGNYKRLRFLEMGLGVDYQTKDLDIGMTNDEIIAIEEIDLLVSQPAVAGVLRAIGITIDGGGSVLTTGVKGFVYVPFSGTILSVVVLSTDASATSGSVQVDLWKTPFAFYPPTVANTITANAKPKLVSAKSSQDVTLSGWTRQVNVGDVIAFNVDSATTVTRVLVQLTVQPST